MNVLMYYLLWEKVQGRGYPCIYSENIVIRMNNIFLGSKEVKIVGRSESIGVAKKV